MELVLYLVDGLRWPARRCRRSARRCHLIRKTYVHNKRLTSKAYGTFTGCLRLGRSSNVIRKTYVHNQKLTSKAYGTCPLLGDGRRWPARRLPLRPPGRRLGRPSDVILKTYVHNEND